MPWAIVETSAFTKQYSKAGLQNSEEAKYQEWRGQVPAHGGTEAANNLGYKVNKLKGTENQWELYVGAKARISFTISKSPDTVTLVAVGHT
jgi:mRNA-degrading endonuclease RelE of RelBE toxin-antitoxin system